MNKDWTKVALELMDDISNNTEIARKIIKDFDLDPMKADSIRRKVSYLRNRSGKSNVDKLKNKSSSCSKSNNYKNKEKFVLSAWNKASGQMMDIDAYCNHYSLPRKDITSYKLVSHTGTPYYNIVFKENIEEQVVDFDFNSIIKKHIKRVKPFEVEISNEVTYTSFDDLTYTDVHIAMDTNPDKNSMYAVEWNREEVLASSDLMIIETIKRQQSSILVVNELGDLLDGMNGQTTRGGHALPQNMTNEEAFDLALEFKMKQVDGLISYYDKIIFNNICNDNHAGSFGYFVNSAFKNIVESKYGYERVTVVNHRQFMNHYYVNDICFVITHGKDDKALKFGFKPQLDSKGIEKIDQYCKQNDIYRNSKLVVFKKGDSHQALFDMCTSDDFYYFNYPALSPSSQWVQTNFKKGRRGFVNETWDGTELTLKPKFITK
jgi:hypothetical protein